MNEDQQRRICTENTYLECVCDQLHLGTAVDTEHHWVLPARNHVLGFEHHTVQFISARNHVTEQLWRLVVLVQCCIEENV